MPSPSCAKESPMLTVHHLNNSRSQRILWLLEELGVPYELANVAFKPPRHSFEQDTPTGKFPALEDDGLVLSESGAILEYLIERHGNGRLMPAAGTPEHLRARYWLHFAEGSAMPPLLLKLIFGTLIPKAPMPFFAKPIARAISAKLMGAMVDPNLKRQLDFMEAELGRSEWFAGNEFSVADVQMSFPVEAAAQRAGLDASRPKLMAFLKRIHARPAYKRALERGGPYSFAID